MNDNNNMKRLFRSRTNRTICGVCGGIGEYLGIDPVIIRILWVILGFASAGMGIIAYFIIALIMPEQMN
ncbi:MAG: PspC domain-containing protein [Lachnospiraceae bacterium]|nr:PspC domain-containing protein [Lachnospiraceae bacterium]